MKPIREAFLEEAKNLGFGERERACVCSAYGIAANDVAEPITFWIYRYAASEHCRKYLSKARISMRNGLHREINLTILVVRKNTYLSDPGAIVFQRWGFDNRVMVIPTNVESEVDIRWNTTPDRNMLDGFVIRE